MPGGVLFKRVIGSIEVFFTSWPSQLITRLRVAMRPSKHDRFDLHRNHRGLFPGQRVLRSRVREALRTLMENIIVGLISLALFAYLLFAMLKPENF
jgi:K+-transporting ATPase KdpF subunit